ncbi:MAG TPA: F0F1 ATP synthase subunit B [Chthoniobacteraceae bacterium]|nr:F0F1 ATP synthase subunit B [Chthoniobacteraceae bacterium]
MKELFETFGVEWPKFIAQVILFIIVYLILKKFAFDPIIAMLEERRKRIEESMLNAEKIKQQLAESEARYKEILSKANTDAQKLIDDARSSSAIIAERKQQQAIADAEQIIAKAREATNLEHDRILSELKREVGRLVVDTTAKVTGKVLTTDDQKRLSDEAARQVTA